MESVLEQKIYIFPKTSCSSNIMNRFTIPIHNHFFMRQWNPGTDFVLLNGFTTVAKRNSWYQSKANSCLNSSGVWGCEN